MVGVAIIMADGTFVSSADLVGMGSDGFVTRYEDHPSGEYEPHVDNDLYGDALDREKAIYERLQDVPGVAECLGYTTNGIRLRYYPNGSLQELISRHGPPPMAWRWQWALQATDAIARCHESGVLVFDIALHNFLLSDEYDLRIIDSENSTLVSRDVDITKVDDDGATAVLDFLHLSTVMYSILTWQDFSNQCCNDSGWPSPDEMPELAGLACGPVIQKCWLREYTCIQDLACEMRQYATTKKAPPSTNPPAWWTFVLPVGTGALRTSLQWLALGAAKFGGLAN